MFRDSDGNIRKKARLCRILEMRKDSTFKQKQIEVKFGELS